MTVALPFLLCLAVLALLISVVRRKLFGPVRQPAPEIKPVAKQAPQPTATNSIIEAVAYEELRKDDMVFVRVGGDGLAMVRLVGEGTTGNNDRYFVARGADLSPAVFVDRDSYAGRVKTQ